MKKLVVTKQDMITISDYINKFTDNWYPQLQHIEHDIKPLVFYSSSEDYTGVTENNWPVPTYYPLNYFKKKIISDRNKYYSDTDTAANKILSAAIDVFKDASNNIESLSSFFILIEGKFDYTQLPTQSVYNHYHPSRGNNLGCHVSTYLMLSNQTVPVTEQFCYADFNQIGVDPPKLYNMDSVAQADAITHYCNLPELQWKQKALPTVESTTLRIDFNAHRYAHNVSPLTENIWVMFVFNDVKFKASAALDSSEMRFAHLQL